MVVFPFFAAGGIPGADRSLPARSGVHASHSGATARERRPETGSTFARASGTVGRPGSRRGEPAIRTTARAGTTVGLAVAFVLLVSLPLAAGAAPGPAAPGATGPTGADAFDVPLAPAGAIPGIDVSHHQDLIDWPTVAASGKQFVFAKATEGRSFVDPMYAINKAGAEAAGLLFGAYHFAQPGAQANDPIVEADHFVDHAQLQPGNLLPVLDIER